MRIVDVTLIDTDIRFDQLRNYSGLEILVMRAIQVLLWPDSDVHSLAQ